MRTGLYAQVPPYQLYFSIAEILYLFMENFKSVFIFVFSIFILIIVEVLVNFCLFIIFLFFFLLSFNFSFHCFST